MRKRGLVVTVLYVILAFLTCSCLAVIPASFAASSLEQRFGANLAGLIMLCIILGGGLIGVVLGLFPGLIPKSTPENSSSSRHTTIPTESVPPTCPQCGGTGKITVTRIEGGQYGDQMVSYEKREVVRCSRCLGSGTI